MQIRVADIPDEGLDLAGTVSVRDTGEHTVGPVAFAVHLAREDGAARLRGWMHVVVHTPCSRCLEETRLPLDRELDLEFRRRSEAPEEDDLELDEEDLDVEYYAGDGFDLRVVLAEQVMLGIPMKVLCDEDCRGLCPQCGINRNREPCDCQPPTDPRLADLAKLRDRL